MRVRGYAALYSAATIFAATSLLVKLASRYYSGLFVSVARFAIGAALCLVVLLWRYKSLRPARPGLVAARGAFGACSMAMGYAAITLTGPGRAALLGNVYPLFVVLFAALFFGERLRPRTLASVAACTAGAVLVVRDGSGAALAGDFLALGGAVLAGFAVNFVRKATQSDNPFMLYLSPCLLGLPLAAIAPLPASTGGAAGVLLVAGVGVAAFFAQALMAYGYREVPAGSGSVVFYLETVLTVLLGAVFAGERFNPRFACGLVLILGGLAANHAPRARARRPL